MSSMEERMYPTSTHEPVTIEPVPATKVEPARTVEAAEAAIARTVDAAEASIVDRLYAKPEIEFDVPDEIKALRETPERRMYSDAARPEINNAITDDVSPETKAAIARELTNMASDIGLNADDITSLTGAARRLAIELPTAEQVTSMQRDAIDALNNAFGANAKAAHAATVALVGRDPRVARYLARTGLGNDPATVLRLAHIAMGKRA